MKFTKTLLLTLMALLAACQSSPPVKTPVEPEPPKTGAEPIDPTDATVAEVVAPNPYELNRPNVPQAARSQFEQALAAMEAEQWSSAEQLLLDLTAKYQQLSGPPLTLAQLYARQNQPEKARQYFNTAVRSNPNNVYAINRFAVFERRQGNFETAETLYQQALSLWPDFADAHLNLGILYDLYRGKLTLALQHYESYQALQPKPDRRVAGWIVDIKRRVKSSRE